MKIEEDREQEERGADRLPELSREKLAVYRRGLEHVAWMHSVLAGVTHSVVALDHWTRAADSIIENIANGNSRRSRDDRNRYCDVAIGSALECAACLDVCHGRELITPEQLVTGKKMLQPIVSMTSGLRKARSLAIGEETETYSGCQSAFFFPHEKLDACKVALELVCWFHGFLRRTHLAASSGKELDKGTTSVALNIAEGNGRFSKAEQIRFLDIAHTCTMRVAAGLDVLAARQQIQRHDLAAGKRLLARLVPLLLGLRGYLDHTRAEA
jgi:four helix bundle protein